MRARIDKAGDANLHALIDGAYSDQYFDGLERQFGLVSGNTETRRKLKNIGVHYLIARRREDDRKTRQDERKANALLARQTNKFLQTLRKAPRDDITFGLHMTALRTDAKLPATIFPELSKHEQRQSGEPYYLELIRLLELLEKSALDQINHFRERRGPKINFGLEYLVRHVADLFLTTLNRPFTIDHHKPIAASEAFDFVAALIAPLDDVSDTEIMTAIRAEQSVRHKLNAKAG
ncbi:MAG: hypothetical protein WDN08_07435 [Rhizomicrobium sp.]